MPNRVRAAIKTGVRRSLRRAGYDIVPLAGGLVDLQKRLLSSVGVAIDVGANVGQFGERLRDIGYAGRIISFEPSHEAFGVLRSKTARDPNWEIRRTALGASSGLAKLNVSANSVSSSLLDVGEIHLRAAPASRIVEVETVPVTTLDSALDGMTDSIYLKLDVQGFELPVITGGEWALAHAAAVQIEVSFADLYEGQTDWLEVCSYLQARGFVMRYVEPGYEDRRTGFMLQADLLFIRRDE